MDIYAILSSKPHNPHYLNRYIKFIQACQVKNIDYKGYTEKHHICPKADDMFPEYKNIKKHSWNCVILTARQHFIAHILLRKTYSEYPSMSRALWQMTNCGNIRISSKLYEILREEHSLSMSISTNKRIMNGTHNWSNTELRKQFQRKRVEDGTHNFLGDNHPMKIASRNGTHHFLDSEYQRNLQLKRIEKGTHHLLNSVSCIDKKGNCIRISKDIYHSQTGPKETHEYVHFNTKEAKRRKANAEL